MKREYIIVLVILIVSYSLLVLHNSFRLEGFTTLSENVVQCGVDLPDCPSGLRCMNGFCRNDNTPKLPASGLPVFPQGYSR